MDACLQLPDVAKPHLYAHRGKLFFALNFYPLLKSQCRCHLLWGAFPTPPPRLGQVLLLDEQPGALWLVL